MNAWVAAGIALVAGVVLGTIAGRLVQNYLKRSQREAISSIAAAVGSLVFSAFLVTGLVTALGFVDEDALLDLKDDLVNYLPRALSAAIVLILGNVAAQLGAAALESTVGTLGPAARRVPTIARSVILAFALILAAAQLGINTTIINIAVASVLGSLGLGAALMIGLGSRQVSSEVAAGRALRHLVRPGDRIVLDDLSGDVVEVGSVAVELETAEGATLLVPNTRMVGEKLTVQRGPGEEDVPDQAD